MTDSTLGGEQVSPDALQALCAACHEFLRAEAIFALAMKDGINVQGAASALLGAETNLQTALDARGADK